MEDPQIQAEEVHKSKLEKERDALIGFLESDGYVAAQKINQELIDQNIQTMLDMKFVSILEVVPLLDMLADIRVRMEFKNQFKDRLSEINKELNPKK